MGWRYRRSVKLFPGLKVNLSKTGTSLSVGGRGATMNIGKRGVRRTLSIPGTGISHVTQRSWGSLPSTSPKPTISPSQQQSRVLKWIAIGVLAWAVWAAFHWL